MSLFTMPLRLPYVGASTIEDAAGVIIAECPDNETAAAIVMIVNCAQEVAVIDRPAMLERATLLNLFKRIKEA